MQTVCPICHTIFRVAATTLHDSDGMVQCGVCGMVFNAHAHWIATTTPLVRTSDSPDAGALEPDIPESADMSVDIGADKLASVTTEQSCDEASTAPESGTGRDTLTEPVVDPSASTAAGTEQIPPSEAETKSLHDPDSNAASFAEHAESEENSLATDAAQKFFSPGEESESPLVVEAPTEGDITDTYAQLADDLADDEKISADYAAFRPFDKNKHPILFTALSTGLIFLLLVQIGYLFRNRLASQLPQTKPALMSLCNAFGCSIALPRAIDALKLSSSELLTDPKQPALMNVSFGLENLSNTAVAYPSISLALINDAGEIVVKHNFKPQDYANQTVIKQGISPRDEISGHLTLKLDQISVSNYKILLYYP